MSTDLSLWFDPAKCLIGGQWIPPAEGGTLALYGFTVLKTVAAYHG